MKCAREGCNIIFDPNGTRRRYCSKKCSSTVKNKKNWKRVKSNRSLLDKEKERRKQYYETNQEKMRVKSKEQYKKHIDYHKGYNRKAASKLRVGREIKNKSLGIPTFGTKSLWDGQGEWSKDYDFCIDCKTNVYKYEGNGLCLSCYRKQTYESKTVSDKKAESQSESRKESMKKSNGKRSSKMKEALVWIAKAENNEIPVDTTIINLLANL